MKLKNIKIYTSLCSVALILLVISSFTSKGQTGEIVTPDSQYRLIPLKTLQYSNLAGKPIAKIGNVIVFKDNRNDPKKVHDINGKIINFGIFGVNTETGKFLFVDGLNDLGYLVFQSKRMYNSNEFYMISANQSKVYKVTIGQDSVISETIYDNHGDGLVTALTEYFNEIVIAESRRGIKVLASNNSVRKFIPYSAEYSSLTQWGDLIVFGGYSFGVIFSMNIETGEIQDIRGNTATINGAFVTKIENWLYADVDGEIYKKNTYDEDWRKIASEINPQTLHFDAIIGEFVLRTKTGINYIFRNDSLLPILVSPYENIQYLESYTHTLYKRYGSEMNFSAGYIFSMNGKTYGVGDGMVGSVEKVLIPGQDTTNGFSKRIQLPQINMHPNPANDVINISNLEKEVDVTITNAVGQNVLLIKKTAGKIDISDLTPDLYFINIPGYSARKFIKK